MDLILLAFYLHQDYKKTNVELELLTDNDILLMFEEGIRGGMCQATYWHAKANNYDENKESSYLVYLDANNLYGYAMSKKLPVGNFKWLDKDDISKFNDELIKKYNENSDRNQYQSLGIPNDLKSFLVYNDLKTFLMIWNLS